MTAKIKLLLHTVRHLTARQLGYQVWYRVHKPKLAEVSSPIEKVESTLKLPIPKYTTWEEEDFCFINLKAPYKGWSNTENGMLWAYNQNYMDWLGQENVTKEDGEKWIDLFIKEISSNEVGLDPYPIALRSINWIKFFCAQPDCGTPKRLDSLYSQIKLLEKKLEFHLMGNHLLEDYYALFIAAVFFKKERMFKKYSRALKGQLEEQILADGAHYEQSPMYHCIMLDRLLDCYNISTSNPVFEKQDEINAFLLEKAQNMLGHLKSVIWEDGSIPLLNDAAYEIAPTAAQLFDYADRLGIQYAATPLKECGYRKLCNKRMEAIVDVGNIRASNQPGHSHADTFNFELRVDGKPLIVDTGISTYNKTSRRLYERSTAAHNTVTINGRNSSEVWSGFKIGKRASTSLIEDSAREIVAIHSGFGKGYLHKRRFIIKESSFTIEDQIEKGQGLFILHLSPNLDIIKVKSDTVVIGNTAIRTLGGDKIIISKANTSVKYNSFNETDVLSIPFTKTLKVTISID